MRSSMDFDVAMISKVVDVEVMSVEFRQDHRERCTWRWDIKVFDILRYAVHFSHD